MSKIRCTKKVRELLVELDTAIGRYQQQAKVLASADISNSTAMEAGLEKEAVKSLIVGIAWRINKASKGIK